MGVFDKIKNALFEEEYVEVEEKPKKVKKVKPKEVDYEEKPIAKKIVLPEKKEIKADELDDDDVLIDDDFEVHPKREKISKKEEFKIMDDDDFKVDSVLEEEKKSQPKIIEEHNDYNSYNEPVREEPRYYQSRPVEREKQPYGIDESTKIKVHEYGSGVYEKKEDKTHFRPSPIISPIYGILDKNYKKEDVVQKKEVRLTSSYSRGKVSVDEIRNKAYGTLSDDIEKEFEEPIIENSFEVDEEENLLVDLTIDDDKPSVKEVTMGDALEYFQDLGLEYNVDYVDAGKEKSARRVKEHYEEFESEDIEKNDDSVIKEKVKVEIKKEQEITKLTKKEDEERKLEEKSKDDSDLDTEDNLFDLIDSMYQDND